MAKKLNALTVAACVAANARPTTFGNRNVGWRFTGNSEAQYLVGGVADDFVLELDIDQSAGEVFGLGEKRNPCTDGPYSVLVERMIAGRSIGINIPDLPRPGSRNQPTPAHPPQLLLLNRVFSPWDNIDGFVVCGDSRILFHRIVKYKGHKLLYAAALLDDLAAWLGVRFTNKEKGPYVDVHFMTYMLSRIAPQFGAFLGCLKPDHCAHLQEVPC